MVVYQSAIGEKTSWGYNSVMRMHSSIYLLTADTKGIFRCTNIMHFFCFLAEQPLQVHACIDWYLTFVSLVVYNSTLVVVTRHDIVLAGFESTGRQQQLMNMTLSHIVSSAISSVQPEQPPKVHGTSC